VLSQTTTFYDIQSQRQYLCWERVFFGQMYVPLPLQQLLPPIVTMRYEEKRINLINRHKSKLLLLRKIILQFAKEKEEMRR
jgi:hypothetical protein